MVRNGGIEDDNYGNPIDQLFYDYDPQNKNQLIRVFDQSSSQQGFKDNTDGITNTTAPDYTYDANGNMTADTNKGIAEIKYNHLNLPTKIIFGTTGTIEYLYDAVGQKLQKKVTEGTAVTKTDYLSGFQYENDALQFFPHAEGYVKKEETAYKYVFNYTDHLGNVRVSYSDWDGNGVLGNELFQECSPNRHGIPVCTSYFGSPILEESNYYPFGLKHEGYNDSDQGTYKYKYNGKELQDELGLNMTAMDFRQYDNATGRFNSIDVLAELDYDYTPYKFAYNNPNYWCDPSGLTEEGSNDITGWVNKGGKTFWDPNVNDQKDARRLHGDDANYVPDNTVLPNADGTSTRYNPDGTKTNVLNEVVVTATVKPKPKSTSPGFSPWGPTLIGLGQPLKFLKPVGALGSVEGSSIASWTLSKAIPYSSPLLKQTTRKVVAKVAGRQLAKRAGTAVVGRFLGRWVPYVGWALTANDIYQNRADIKSWAEEQQASNEENKTNDDGTWNAGWNASTCFIKGTLIYSENKFIPIENIKIGDVVYSYNIEKEKVELSKVINILNRETQGIYEIVANKETIFVTAEHPIYVVGKGWIKVKDLKAGDILKSSEDKEKIKITSIKKLIKTVTVYNIEVDGNHNYFITNSSILVHNKNITEIKQNSEHKKHN